MRNGFLCSLLAMLCAVPALIADPPPVTLGRPVPLNDAVRLQRPVFSESPIVQAGAFAADLVSPPAIYRGQAPPPADPFFPPPAGPAAPPPGVAPAPIPACPPAGCTPRVWVDGEFLFWWVKNAPEPFGGSANYGVFPGLKLEGGGWIGPAQKWGLEASGFFLSRKSSTLGVVSGSIPFEDLVITTGAAAYVDSQLWGAEFNGLYNLCRSCNFHADLIGGFRYLGLQEDLKAYASGIVVLPGAIEGGTATARLMAQNNFYGGQIGARAGWNFDRWFADITGKIALGVTREGLTAQAVANGTDGEVDTFQLRRSKSELAVLPEINFRVGYNFTRNIHAFVGYDFLFISNVARPGNQDLIGLFGGAPSVHSSNFWAQGINFGVEFTY